MTVLPFHSYSASLWAGFSHHTSHMGNLGLSILPKDTLAHRIGETGIEPPTMWLVNNLLYLLSHTLLDLHSILSTNNRLYRCDNQFHQCCHFLFLMNVACKHTCMYGSCIHTFMYVSTYRYLSGYVGGGPVFWTFFKGLEPNSAFRLGWLQWYEKTYEAEFVRKHITDTMGQ